MMANPRIGQRVQVWYKKALASWFPLHGKVGVVVIRARGRGPRNHGIVIDGVLWVVPCGNLRKPPTEPISLSCEKVK